MRQFKNERLVAEMKETDSVTVLATLSESDYFAYALANGTVGVYYRLNRLWRIKVVIQIISRLNFYYKLIAFLFHPDSRRIKSLPLRLMTSITMVTQNSFVRGVTDVLMPEMLKVVK